MSGWGGGVGVSDHGLLGGLGDDDHTQYALLNGRSGGQTFIGGTGSAEGLTLQATSHGTDGPIIFKSDPTTERARILGATGNLLVGVTSLTGIGSTTADLIFVQKVQNFTTEIVVRNNDSGVFAAAQFAAKNGTGFCQYGVTGTGYTVGGDILAANEGYLYTSAAAGIYIGSPDSIYIRLVTSNAERIYIGTDGRVHIGSGAAPSGIGFQTTHEINSFGASASAARLRLRGFYTASPANPPENESDLMIIDTGAATVFRVRYNDAGSMKVGDLTLV